MQSTFPSAHVLGFFRYSFLFGFILFYHHHAQHYLYDVAIVPG